MDAPEIKQPRPDSLVALVEDFKELEDEHAPLGKLDDLRAKIISTLKVSNKYVKAGKYGVAKAHSHWGNDFLSIQDWTTELESAVLEDK